MTSSLHSPQLDQREEKHNLLVEVSEKEKQLVMLIHTKGLLNTDVQELYRKVRSGYEKIILNDNEQSEVQDVEYCLWKLHYKHIDEFRKRIKKTSTSESTQSREQHNTIHLEVFKVFLLEAAQFYRNLIVKIRKSYRLLDELSFSRKGGVSRTHESNKAQMCQFLCHRFLICLGDLARYKEQYEKPDAQNHNWSVAATCYLEATEIWPDSGNPQNQLAVLATYVGDEFLALYHCIRSLAVKEPFPDAEVNLRVLLERNRSSFSPSVSSRTLFNFLKPSERCCAKKNTESSDDFSFGNTLNAKESCSMETNLWSLIIRLIGFFFLESSFDDFPIAFGSIMRELDALMTLNDTELKVSLESYQQMDSVKTGPFRTLHIVSVFLYTLHNLINSPKATDYGDTNGTQLIVLRQWALLATFVVMGRFVERCLKANSLSSCPLLPAVLVFVEWLTYGLNEAEKYRVDKKCRIAMSYFFDSFVDLLKRFGAKKSKGNSSHTSPLWEDYELRGFAPVACAHESLDFSSSQSIDNFEKGAECRVQRIINAGQMIHDQSGGKLLNIHVAQFNQILETKDPEKVEPVNINLITDANDQYFDKNGESEKFLPWDYPSADINSVTAEDEEVILFNPLTRYSSDPAFTNSNEPPPLKQMEDPTVPPDGFLPHPTSLFKAQNQVQGRNPSHSPQADTSKFGHHRAFEQQEHVFKDASAVAHPFQHTQPVSAGPPSLSSWVIDGGNSLAAKAEAPSGAATNKRHVLSPILEVNSESLSSLSITENEDLTIKASSFPATHHASSPFAVPAPSAPLLPDDAAWYAGIQHSFHNCNVERTETLNDAASQTAKSSSSSHLNWTAAQAPAEYTLGSTPGLTLNYPAHRQMTSSEWLRHYLQTHHNLVNRGYINHPWPLPSYYYASTGSLGSSSSPTSSATVQVETPPLYTALPLDYGSSEEAQRREKLLFGYQRPGAYVCGAVTDVMNSEPQPLLQYLKERERQLQAHDPRTALMRGPTYLGN